MHVRIMVKVLRVRIALVPVFFLKHTIVFVQILSIRLSMLVRVGQGLGEEVLVEYNGHRFKYNDLVDVTVGTGHGVVGKNCEPLKARFKGQGCGGDSERD